MEIHQHKLPKVSIITVSYNSAKTIEQTIQSVVNQTYSNIEYIIIDGGSTDGTVDIIKKYEEKLAYWESKPDNGIYDAMNKGINYSTGDYIQFLGSDDCLVSNDIIDKITQILMDNQNTDILSGLVWIVDEDLCLQKIYSNQFTKADVYNGYVIHHQGMFTRRLLLEEMPFNTDYKIVSDYEFFLKCYFNPNIEFKYINIPISFYSTSGTSNTLVTKRLDEQIEVMKQYNLSQNAILNLQERTNLYQRIIRSLKAFVKQLLKNVGWLKFAKSKVGRGWIAHSCNWTNCRWDK